MNDGNNVFKNISEKLTKPQKVGVVLGIVIIVLLLVFVLLLTDGLFNGGGGSELEEEVVEETYVEDGDTVIKETRRDEEGNVTVVETREESDGSTVTVETYTNTEGDVTTTGTKEDAYGNVTTLDPALITTYFPYQVMREHEGGDPTLRYYVAVDEGSKTISALIEACDEEGDKALVQQYINSIPLNLSSYTINYESFDEDAICEYSVSDTWD